MLLGVIQQLRGQNFAIFCPSLLRGRFYILSVDNNRHFCHPPPTHLVYVVIEWPLTMVRAHLNFKGFWSIK